DASRASYRANMTLGLLSLSTTVGQHVMIKDGETWNDAQKGVTFVISQVVGSGADTFVSLAAPDGSTCEWFRIDELQAAGNAAVAPTSAPPPASGAPLGKPRKHLKPTNRIGK